MVSTIASLMSFLLIGSILLISTSVLVEASFRTGQVRVFVNCSDDLLLRSTVLDLGFVSDAEDADLDELNQISDIMRTTYNSDDATCDPFFRYIIDITVETRQNEEGRRRTRQLVNRHPSKVHLLKKATKRMFKKKLTTRNMNRKDKKKAAMAKKQVAMAKAATAALKKKNYTVSTNNNTTDAVSEFDSSIYSSLNHHYQPHRRLSRHDPSYRRSLQFSGSSTTVSDCINGTQYYANGTRTNCTSTTEDRPLSFYFRVNYSCRGCPKDTNLFDDGIQRRTARNLFHKIITTQQQQQQQQQRKLDILGIVPTTNTTAATAATIIQTISQQHHHHHRVLEDNKDGNNAACVCEANVAANETLARAPTVQEFTDIVNDTIVTQAEEGTLTTVEAVQDTIIEGYRVCQRADQCDGDDPCARYQYEDPSRVSVCCPWSVIIDNVEYCGGTVPSGGRCPQDDPLGNDVCEAGTSCIVDFGTCGIGVEDESPVSCRDLAGWVDSYGDGCDWYEDTEFGCDSALTYADVITGVSAIEACCVCQSLGVDGLGDSSSGGGGSVSSEGDEECFDYVGWLDSADDGCSWYVSNGCSYAGSYVGVNGVSAFDACCFCGGGDKNGDSSFNNGSGFTGNTPSIGGPTDSDGCADSVGFLDSFGDGCEWYVENGCLRALTDTNDDGVSALDACCVCEGGGARTENGVAPSEASGPTSECIDTFGFVDSAGDGCDFYDKDKFWCVLADQYINSDGVDAVEACCVCGGGSTSFSLPSSSCTDTSGWVDSFGDGCVWYFINGCDNAIETQNGDGVSALDACCVCETVLDAPAFASPMSPFYPFPTPAAPSPFYPTGISPFYPLATRAPSTLNSDFSFAPSVAGCVDFSGWRDSGDDGCSWYGTNYRCSVASLFANFDGTSALDACCVCGGGTASSGP